MRDQVFGNLEEWGHVLEQLAQLGRAGTLDEHQPELAHLLRYDGNWRLREAALEAVRHIKQPADALVGDVLHVMTNESLYYEVRALAAEALGHLIVAGRSAPGRRNRTLEQQALAQMHTLLDSCQPPVLHQAVRRVLPTIE